MGQQHGRWHQRLDQLPCLRLAGRGYNGRACARCESVNDDRFSCGIIYLRGNLSCAGRRIGRSLPFRHLPTRKHPRNQRQIAGQDLRAPSQNLLQLSLGSDLFFFCGFGFTRQWFWLAGGSPTLELLDLFLQIVHGDLGLLEGSPFNAVR